MHLNSKMDKSKTIVFNQSPPDRICPGFIYTRNGTIQAVRKHIEPGEALAGAAVGVGVEEALDDWVVISALQIVEPGFGIAVVAPVAQRIDVCDGAGLGEHIAPGVVAILGVDLVLFALVVKLHHVTLCVEHVMEGIVAGERGIVVAPHGEGSAVLVVEEVQTADKGPGAGVGHIVADYLAILGDIFMPQALSDFHAAHAGHVVFVGIGLIAFFQAAQPPALRPGQMGVFCAVVPVLWIQRVPGVVDGSGRVIYGNRGQLVRPGGIAIGVSNHFRAVDLDAAQIARRVSGILNDRRACRRAGSPVVGIAGFLLELIHPIVRIFRFVP